MRNRFFLVFGLVLAAVTLSGAFAWAADFEDVANDAWYLQEYELMNGNSETDFVPEECLTRAMLMLALMNIGGWPAVQNETELTNEVTEMNIQIGDYTFAAVLEDNAAVRELVDMLRQQPLTINMTDYSGFEKVGALGRSLTVSNSQITTAEGDIVLYNGNSIVMFYGSNSWSYTRIGRVRDLTDWRAALGSGGITAVFSLPQQ